ncbi:hypothetical protein Q7P36_006406 [Cladosporium allicinum]
MSYIAINSNGPTYEHPIVEQNAERLLRPVIVKYRKVKGKRGWLLRRVGRYLGAPDTPEGMAHAALMVGDYVHELHTDEANQKYLVAQRLTGDQIWPSTVSEWVQGYTTMTDQEIADNAMRVQSWMRGRERGKYDVRLNNCHHFVNELVNRVAVDTKIHSDDESTRSSSWSGSSATLHLDLDLDEKPFKIVLEVEETMSPPFSEK